MISLVMLTIQSLNEFTKPHKLHKYYYTHLRFTDEYFGDCFRNFNIEVRF